jgi:hypothetical protein
MTCRRRSLTAVLVVWWIASLVCADSRAQSILVPDSGFVEEPVVSDLPPTTGVAFGPQDTIYLAQKEGIVRVAKGGALLSTPFIDISAMTNR